MNAPHPLHEGDLLLFEHIPKTAGSTLRTILARRYGDALFRYTNMREVGPRLAQLSALIEAGTPPSALVSHVGYGLHERLPGALRYVHLTFLRDPVQRTLSNYYFDLQGGRLPEGTSLVEYCETGVFPWNAMNAQTAFLGGLRAEYLLSDRRPRPGEYDEALLARAKANLDRFAAVGLVERFDESLLLFGRTFGWPLLSLRYYRENVGKRRPRRLALTEEEQAALEAANRLDRELYRYAERRFEVLLAERVPDLPGRLRALSRLNLAYRAGAPAVNSLDAIKRRLRRSFRARPSQAHG